MNARERETTIETRATQPGRLGTLLVMMWSAVFPPESNPFLDDHLIYAGLLITVAVVGAEDTLGLGTVWGRTPLVRRPPWLK